MSWKPASDLRKLWWAILGSNQFPEPCASLALTWGNGPLTCDNTKQ